MQRDGSVSPWWASHKVRLLHRAAEHRQPAEGRQPSSPLSDVPSLARRKAQLLLSSASSEPQMPELLEEPERLLVNRWASRLPLGSPAGLDEPFTPSVSEESVERLRMAKMANRVRARLGSAQLSLRQRREAEEMAEMQPACRFADVLRHVQLVAALQEWQDSSDTRSKSATRREREHRQLALRAWAEVTVNESRSLAQRAAELLPWTPGDDDAPVNETIAVTNVLYSSNAAAVEALLRASRDSRRGCAELCMCGLSQVDLKLTESGKHTGNTDGSATREWELPDATMLVTERMRESRVLREHAMALLSSAAG